jgi:hypothetical protein
MLGYSTNQIVVRAPGKEVLTHGMLEDTLGVQYLDTRDDCYVTSWEQSSSASQNTSSSSSGEPFVETGELEQPADRPVDNGESELDTVCGCQPPTAK